MQFMNDVHRETQEIKTMNQQQVFIFLCCIRKGEDLRVIG